MVVGVMSDGELTRLKVVRDLDQGRLTLGAAAELLGLRVRQLFRILKAYRVDGVDGLISKQRGRPSNRKMAHEVRAALDLGLPILRAAAKEAGPAAVDDLHRRLNEAQRWIPQD